MWELIRIEKKCASRDTTIFIFRRVDFKYHHPIHGSKCSSLFPTSSVLYVSFT